MKCRGAAFVEVSTSSVPGHWRAGCGWYAVLLFSAVVLWPGCTEIAVQRSPGTGAGIAAGERLTVMLHFYNKMPPDEMEAVERKVAKCVAKGMRHANLDVRVVPPDEFRRVAFPDLAFEEIPRTPESLTQLVANPTFQARIAPLALRYLVIVTGGTAESAGTGGFVATTPYPGAFGFLVWERRSNLGALVLDVKQARTAEELRVEASGHPWFAIIGWLPVGVPVFTKHRACEEFGDAVAEAIANPPPTPAPQPPPE